MNPWTTSAVISPAISPLVLFGFRISDFGFHFFASPALLLILTAVPVLAVLGWMARARRRRALAALGPPYALLPLVEHPRRRRTGLALGLALTTLAVGVAGPRWGEGPSPPVAPGRDLVVVIDLSRSMLAQDVLPNRLDRARAALAALADAAQARGGHRLALVAVAANAKLVCPLTHDYDAFRLKLTALDADVPPPSVRAAGPAASGTRLGSGLRLAVQALDPRHRGAQDVLLVSDGDDPAGDEEWRVGLAEARAAGVPVATAGVGDPDRDSPIPTAQGRLRYQGEPVHTRLREEPLREIARRTGGTYLAARTAPLALDDWFRAAVAPGPTREAVEGTLPQPPGRQAWFFAAALSFLGLAQRPRAATRGYLRALWDRVWRAKPQAAAVALFLVAAAPAIDEALRRGNAALAAGRADEALAHYARAAEFTPDPGQVAFNAGAAHFARGRYREAELCYRRCLSDADGDRRTRALYNLGCCLLQESAGRRARPLRQAVTCFEQAMDRADAALQPDVRHNLELAKRLLAQARAASPHAPDSGEDDPPDAPPPAPAPPDGPSPAGPGRDPGQALGPGDGAPQTAGPKGAPAAKSDRPPPPGKGNLPPLPDDDVLVQLTPEDARAHLERAAARIDAERRARLKQTAPPPSQQYPEW